LQFLTKFFSGTFNIFMKYIIKIFIGFILSSHKCFHLKITNILQMTDYLILNDPSQFIFISISYLVLRSFSDSHNFSTTMFTHTTFFSILNFLPITYSFSIVNLLITVFYLLHFVYNPHNYINFYSVNLANSSTKSFYPYRKFSS
jgi:hypothetical protein